jgi:hypothetical protein
MCNNFLQQMEIDALEQLISEDVKVQGQISCMMVSELASWSLESSSELLPESSPEEMGSTNTTILPGRRWRSPHSPQCAWTASTFALRKKPCLSMVGVTGVRQLGRCARVQLPPWADEEPTSSMEHRGRRTWAARWDGSFSSPQNLILLARAADSTEEDGRGRDRGASSLQKLP